jgi:anaerobic ribonucleoside-triphosphate reductase activating protein
LIGGEPFDQPAGGAALASAAQAQDLGVITFSGYEYESLLGGGDATEAFLAATDLLVDGPYKAQHAEPGRALVGSSNQRFLHLSDRYKGYTPEITANRIDVRVRSDGSINVAGFLTMDGLKDLLLTTETSRAFPAGLNKPLRSPNTPTP